MITSKDDGILIPIPQYPLYSAAISLYGGYAAPYYMNEQTGWQLDFSELERSIEDARKKGKKCKALVIINPGNPTGSILSEETIKKVLEFSVKNRLVVIADEVFIPLARSTDKIFTRKEPNSSHSEESSKQ